MSGAVDPNWPISSGLRLPNACRRAIVRAWRDGQRGAANPLRTRRTREGAACRAAKARRPRMEAGQVGGSWVGRQKGHGHWHTVIRAGGPLVFDETHSMGGNLPSVACAPSSTALLFVTATVTVGARGASASALDSAAAAWASAADSAAESAAVAAASAFSLADAASAFALAASSAACTAAWIHGATAWVYGHGATAWVRACLTCPSCAGGLA